MTDPPGRRSEPRYSGDAREAHHVCDDTGRAGGPSGWRGASMCSTAMQASHLVCRRGEGLASRFPETDGTKTRRRAPSMPALLPRSAPRIQSRRVAFVNRRATMKRAVIRLALSRFIRASSTCPRDSRYRAPRIRLAPAFALRHRRGSMRRCARLICRPRTITSAKRPLLAPSSKQYRSTPISSKEQRKAPPNHRRRFVSEA